MLAQENDSLSVKFEFLGQPKEIELSYNEIFFGIGEKLFAQCEISEVERFLGEIIFEKYEKTQEFLDYLENENAIGNRYRYDIKVSEQSLTEMEIQLQALELITISGFAKQYSARTLEELRHHNNQPSIHTEIAKTWVFTKKGKKYYLSQRAIRREKQESLSD